MLSTIQEAEIVFFETASLYGTFSIKKLALQQLCAEIERGRLILPSHRIRLVQSMLYTKDEDDIKVRRWTCKLIALIKANQYKDVLQQRILVGEEDAENLTWALAALAKLERENNEIKRLIFAAPSRDFKPHHHLPVMLYSKHDTGLLPAGIELVRDIERFNLGAKWLCLLYGYSVDTQHILPGAPKEIVQSFNRHHDPDVAEYSIWALHRMPDASIDDLKIPLDALHEQPENVRARPRMLCFESG